MQKREFNAVELTVVYLNEDDVIRTSAGVTEVVPGEGDMDFD
jgi:hypothetical protein